MKHRLLRAHIGLLLVAIPIPLLLFPSKTPVGGVPGFASFLFFCTGWPPGAIMLALNLATLGLTAVTIGIRHSGRSLYAALVLAVIVEGLYRLVPLPVVTTGLWPWIMQAAAAIIMGSGLAIAVAADYSPAGTAILSVILNHYTGIRTVIWMAAMDAMIAIVTAIWISVSAGARTLVGITLMYTAYIIVEHGYPKQPS